MDIQDVFMCNFVSIHTDTKRQQRVRMHYSHTCLNERVDVQHESLSPADDELINAGDGVRPATQ